MPIRIAIVEDDEEIRKLTAGILNFYDDLECVGSFGSAEQFLQSLPGLQPDVVLMDIGLPGMSGIDCVETCKALASDSGAEECKAEFIMFTNHTDSREVFDALKAGATGYVLKNGTPEQLARAIRDVMDGGSPMSRQISRMVTAYFRNGGGPEPPEPAMQETPTPPDKPGPLAAAQSTEQLTEQEKIVLDLLAEGLSYKEIAAKRFVSEHTVRTQVRSIYRKLQVHNRTGALNKRNKNKE